MDHEYSSQIEDVDNDLFFVEGGNFVECEKGNDELLIDAIREYPHLYSPSLKEYKNIQMKENSWSEIASLMNMSVADCQTRWLRLRDRFTKEQRLQEIDSRSGSGANHRPTFNLYNNMLFLKKHIKRRKSFTNVNVPIKKTASISSANKYPYENMSSSLHNISCDTNNNISDLNKSSSSISWHNDSNISLAQSEMTTDRNFSCIPQEARIQSKQIEIDHILNSTRLQDKQNQRYVSQGINIYNDHISQENRNETESYISLSPRNESRNSQTDHSISKDSSPSSVMQINYRKNNSGNRNKTESNMLLSSQLRNESRNSQTDHSISKDSSPPPAMQINSRKSNNGKIKNKSSTYLESSLANLSNALQNRFANQSSHSNEQNIWNMNTLTPEQSFGLLVATELERIPELERTRKKQAIIDILWKSMQ